MSPTPCRRLPRFVYATKNGKFRVALVRNGLAYRETFDTLPEAANAARAAAAAAGPSNCRRWDHPEDDRLRALAEQGASLKQIATTLGRTQAAVRARLARLTQPHQPHQPHQPPCHS